MRHGTKDGYGDGDDDGDGDGDSDGDCDGNGDGCGDGDGYVDGDRCHVTFEGQPRLHRSENFEMTIVFFIEQPWLHRSC